MQTHQAAHRSLSKLLPPWLPPFLTLSTRRMKRTLISHTEWLSLPVSYLWPQASDLVTELSWSSVYELRFNANANYIPLKFKLLTSWEAKQRIFHARLDYCNLQFQTKKLDNFIDRFLQCTILLIMLNSEIKQLSFTRLTPSSNGLMGLSVCDV